MSRPKNDKKEGYISDWDKKSKSSDKVFVYLTAIDLEWIDKNVKRIVEHNKKVGKVDKKHDVNQSSYDAHYLGMMGEYAVSKHLGCELPNVELLTGGDNGIDLTIGRYQIQVKTTKMANPALIFDDIDDFKTNVALLAKRVSPVCVWLVGITGRSNFLLHWHEHDYGYGNRMVLYKKYLSSVDMLREQ